MADLFHLPSVHGENRFRPRLSREQSVDVGRTRVDHRAKEATVTIICATDARQSVSTREGEGEKERGRRPWWKRDGETAHLHLLNAAVSTVRHVDGGANRGCPLAVGRGGRGETSLVGRSLSPRVSRGTPDSSLPRPRLDVREGPDGSLPVLVTVSITQLLTAGIAPVPFIRASFPSVSVLHRHRLELRILSESENGRGQEEGDSVGEGFQGRGELTLKDDG